MNVSKLAREAGLNVQTVHTRLRMGWSLEEALSRPVREHTRAVVTPAEAAETEGLDPVGTQYHLRLTHGEVQYLGWTSADPKGARDEGVRSERFENSPAVEEPTSFVARAFADLGSVFRRMLGLS